LKIQEKFFASRNVPTKDAGVNEGRRDYQFAGRLRTPLSNETGGLSGKEIIK
jgi:hypothetical protein